MAASLGKVMVYCQIGQQSAHFIRTKPLQRLAIECCVERAKQGDTQPRHNSIIYQADMVVDVFVTVVKYSIKVENNKNHLKSFYYARLLRIWESCKYGDQGLRASLEDPHTSKTEAFTSLTALCDHLLSLERAISVVEEDSDSGVHSTLESNQNQE